MSERLSNHDFNKAIAIRLVGVVGMLGTLGVTYAHVNNSQSEVNNVPITAGLSPKPKDKPTQVVIGPDSVEITSARATQEVASLDSVKILQIGHELPIATASLDSSSIENYVGIDELCTMIAAARPSRRGPGLASPLDMESGIDIGTQRKLLDCLKASRDVLQPFFIGLGGSLDTLEPSDIVAEDTIENLSDDIITAVGGSLSQDDVEQTLGLKGGKVAWTIRDNGTLASASAEVIDGVNPGRGQISRHEQGFLVKIKDTTVVFLTRCKNPFLTVFRKKAEFTPTASATATATNVPSGPPSPPEQEATPTNTARATIVPQKTPLPTFTEGPAGPTETPQPVATEIPTQTPTEQEATPTNTARATIVPQKTPLPTFTEGPAGPTETPQPVATEIPTASKPPTANPTVAATSAPRATIAPSGH